MSVQSTSTNNYDIILAVHSQVEVIERKEKPFHQHIFGYRGASSLGTCNYKEAYGIAGLKYPIVTGLKADTGAMNVGKIWHTVIQNMVINDFKRTNKDPFLYMCKEVYVEVQMSPGVTSLSPIDLAIIRCPPNIINPLIKRTVTFRSQVVEVVFKHPDATFVQIFDIKTADNLLAFWKYKKEGTPFPYVAQMHNYMVGALLKECTILYINKGNLRMFTDVIYFDEKVWLQVVDKTVSKYELAKVIQNHEQIPLTPENFTYLGEDDDFECKYCALSETEEVISNEWDKESLILRAPCAPAKEHCRKLALEKFKVGNMWKRGSSHVTINKIEGDMIYCKNKGNTPFEDTLFYALKNYTMIEPRKKQDSISRQNAMDLTE